MSNFVDVAQAIEIRNLQMVEDTDTILQTQKGQEEERFNPPVSLKILVGYLYFIQGLVLALPETMTIVYPQLPPYEILSVFSAASIPFSIKFLVAPFIEKYTKISYGKRKTWIMISLSVTSIMLFLASFFTDQKFEIIMAIFLVCIVFLITLQDISLDALAIKQLRLPHLVGFLQAIMQTTGIIFGSLILLKLTSMEFAENIGLSEPICHPSLIFRVASFLIFSTTFFIHYLYNQRTLKSERTVNKKKFCEILKFYRVFFDFKSKYCRTTLLFLIYIQGFNLYQAGYEYQLIKAGFKRNTFNTISNISLVPISIMACMFSQRIEKFGLKKSFITYLILRETLATTVVIFFPTNVPAICVIYFCNQALEVFKFLLIGILVNSFPVNGISGMLITMLVSGANFGSLKTISLILTGKLGWRVCASVGLTLQLGIIGVFSRLFEKTEEGQIQIDTQLNEQQSSDGSQTQKQIQFSREALEELKEESDSILAPKNIALN